MIGQTFHVISQVSGWAAMTLPVPPIATQISCYTNKVNANACFVGSNGSYNSIGIINGDSSSPDIFSINDNMVVLPHPLGPTIAINSLSLTSNEIFCNAIVSPLGE